MCTCPKLTVVMPVYNAERTLSRSITSVLRQTLMDLELILIDDGSTDSSGDICDFFKAKDERIHVIHQKNMGQGIARIIGYEKARGTYVACIDSDDWIEADMYETLYREIGDADLITSGFIRNAPNGAVEEYIHDGVTSGKYDINDGSFWNNAICSDSKVSNHMYGILPHGWNKLYRRRLMSSFLNQLKKPIHIGEDWLFVLLYLLKCSSVKILHNCWYHYCMNNQSVTQSLNQSFLSDMEDIYKIFMDNVQGHRWESVLTWQFQKTFMYDIYSKTGAFLGIDERLRCPIYRFPQIYKLRGMKVVLFGAGLVGRNYLIDWKNEEEIDVVLWVDNAPHSMCMFEKKVSSPEKIKETEYDFVVCGVIGKEAADGMVQQLVEMGVPREKILWEKPKDMWREFFSFCNNGDVT